MQQVPFKPTSITAGLGNFFPGSEMRDYGFEAFQNRREIREHPFGLDFPNWESKFHSNWAFLDVSSERAVRFMAASLSHVIRDVTPHDEEKAIRRLRIFNVQCDPEKPELHFCYFEVWTYIGLYLNGGCTDHTGGGGSANKAMRSIFSLLSVIYKVDVEEFEIPYEKSRNLYTLRVAAPAF